jgi:hypothetical protein
MAALAPLPTFLFDTEIGGGTMVRTLIVTLATAVGLAVPGIAAASSDADAVLREDEDGVVLVAAADDDDGQTGNTGANSGTGDSNDATGSRHTGVSRDGENSAGDLTRDRTKDGPGPSRIDRTGNGTNDRTRNDTR